MNVDAVLSEPIIARFWDKVEPMFDDRGCWEWRGRGNQSGYGQLFVGYDGIASRPVLAHRASWRINVGPIPNGLCVLHRCDNPPCVNPGHLFLGTRLVNNRDMIAKGRFVNHLSLKTACPRGHAYDRVSKSGSRLCTICKLDQQRIKRAAERLKK